MRRPVIGICTSLERARFGAWNEVAALLPQSYIAAVQKAGGMALLLAPDAHLEAEPDEVLDLLDGLILAGGVDIDPSTYGAEPDPETVGTVPERDTFEIALAKRAHGARPAGARASAAACSCMNVALGGTLLQHVPDVVGSRRAPPQPRDLRRQRPPSSAWRPARPRRGSPARRSTSPARIITRRSTELGDGLEGHRLGGGRRPPGGGRAARQPLRRRRPVAPRGRRDLAASSRPSSPKRPKPPHER